MTISNLMDSASVCTSCNGTGEVEVWRNSRGDVDYLDGRPTGEATECDTCLGEGYRY